MSSAQEIENSNPKHIDTSAALSISTTALDLSEDSSLSVSATFFPGAQLRPSESDIVFLTPDFVFFSVHSSVLLSRSKNGFNSLLLPALVPEREAVIVVPDSSKVFNVVLHAIYSLPGSHYDPTLATLEAALTALQTYGIDLHDLNRPSNLLFSRLLFYAPSLPLDVYILAARHNLDDIASSCSSHLLSFPLHALSDEEAEAMGPLYLKRLFFLHMDRFQALKNLLLPLPFPHAPTPDCDFADQQKLTRAWAFASAPLAWDSRPDTSTLSLESALLQCGEDSQCRICRKNIQKHIRDIIVQWSLVKRTI